MPLILRCFPALAYLDAANCITGINVTLSMAGITLVVAGLPQWGALTIFAAALCDYIDGHVARTFLADLTDNREFGKQLDSFADLLNFSVVPAIAMMVTPAATGITAMVAACLVLSSVIRLAHFSVASSASGYTGIPTTYTGFILANVLLLTATGVLAAHWMPALALVGAIFQVANIPVPKLRTPVVVTGMTLIFIGTASVAYFLRAP